MYYVLFNYFSEINTIFILNIKLFVFLPLTSVLFALKFLTKSQKMVTYRACNGTKPSISNYIFFGSIYILK